MSRPPPHPADPRYLIYEAYRIEGLGDAECRSIFFDWALGLPDGTDAASAARALREHHAGEPPEHPMSRLLDEASRAGAGPEGRGRRRRRR